MKPFTCHGRTHDVRSFRQTIACREAKGTRVFPVLRPRAAIAHRCVCKTVGMDTSVPTLCGYVSEPQACTLEEHLSSKRGIKSREGPEQVSSLPVCRLQGVEKKDTIPLSA